MVTTEVKTLGSVIALTLLLFLLTLSSTMLSSTIGLKDDTNTNEDPSHSSLTPRPSYEPFNGSISIESNSGFTIENGVSSGSGTQSDPYIIENLSFEVGTVPAIKIANTKAHLIIRNVTVVGGRSGGVNSLEFFQVSNISLLSSNIDNGSLGLSVQKGDKFLINKCKFEQCNSGIFLSEVSWFTLEKNTILRCLGIGSIIKGSSFMCLIRSNNFINNKKEGAVLEGSFFDLKIDDNNISNNMNTGLRCEDITGKNFTVMNNMFSNNWGFGTYLKNCATIRFTNNTITHNPSGGILGERLIGSGIDICWNDIFNNGIYGMELQNVRDINIGHNIVAYHENVGIYLGSSSKNNKVYNNTITKCENDGIRLGGSLNTDIIDNNISQCWSGLVSIGTENNIINNKIWANEFGINIYSSTDVFCYANDISFNRYGISLFEYCFGSIIEANQYHDNIVDITTSEAASYTTISKNIFLSGSDISLKIERSKGTKVISNYFLGNGTSLRLDGCIDTLIADNLLENPTLNLNGQDPDLVNFSYPSKIIGRNIIGGAYRYGNYWSNYIGEDIDGDGIGDTMLPHFPGDVGPLVKDPPPPDTEPPLIEKLDDILPRTGSTCKVHLIVSDNRSLFQIRLSGRYYQHGPEGILETILTQKDFDFGADGRLNITLFVKERTAFIELSLKAVDFSTNVREFKFSFEVIDTIGPEFWEISYPDEAKTGKDFVVNVRAVDNIAITSMIGYCWFGLSATEILINGSLLKGSKTDWELVIPVHRKAIVLQVKLSIRDRYGNNKESYFEITVDDILPPTADDISFSSPETGGKYYLWFEIRDNIALLNLNLIINLEGGEPTHFTRKDDLLDHVLWTMSVDIPISTKSLSYTLVIKDTNGNYLELNRRVTVIDTIEPLIERVGSDLPMTGRKMDLSFSCWDNIGITSGTLVYWFDSSPSIMIDVTSDLSLAVYPPEISHVLHYRITVFDSAWNNFTLYDDIDVIDVIPPSNDPLFSVPLTSHAWEVELNASDNIGVNRTWVDHSFDGGPKTTLQSDVNGSVFINIPSDSKIVMLTVFAEDTSGLVTSIERIVEIGDGTPPEIEHSTLRYLKNGVYEFSLVAKDNREISRAWIYLYDEDANVEKVSMEMISDGNYSLQLSRDKLEGYLEYEFIIEDTSGMIMTSGRNRIILGTDPTIMTVIIIMSLTIILIISVIAILTFVLAGNREVRIPFDKSPVMTVPPTKGLTRPREVMLPPKPMEE